MTRSALLLAFLFVAGSACTKPNPAAVCQLDGSCLDPAFPFCDRDGVIGGTPGRCIAVDCTPGQFEACVGDSALVCSSGGEGFETTECAAGCDSSSGCKSFCTPGAAIECTNDELRSCNAEGTATVTESCTLGCATTEARCLTFEPSNGLGPALADAAGEEDVVLPAGTRIDTDLGLVQDANGTVLPVKTFTVDQVGGAPIRVFESRSFEMQDVTVTGMAPFAFVAAGEIRVSGRLKADAIGSDPGPGARLTGVCFGADSMQLDASNVCGAGGTATPGAGGGGNHDMGGNGGANNPNGGNGLTGFSPLAGGCAGGTQRKPDGANVFARGGGGGGAVQLVSLTSVVLTGAGLIDVGGGGGGSTAGGGSGGIVIIEAPLVSFSGPGSGIAANGGAGGGCGMTGPDAGSTTAAAIAPTCSQYFGGSGGTGTKSPGDGCFQEACGASDCPEAPYGGGGGSVGRMRIATKDGAFATSGAPILSVRITTGALIRK